MKNHVFTAYKDWSKLLTLSRSSVLNEKECHQIKQRYQTPVKQRCCMKREKSSVAILTKKTTLTIQ